MREDWVGAEVYNVGTVFKTFVGGPFEVDTVGTEQDAGELNPELVRELSTLAEQFEGDRMDGLALVFDEDPYVPIRLKVFG
jgi:hypothetical protein